MVAVTDRRLSVSFRCLCGQGKNLSTSVPVFPVRYSGDECLSRKTCCIYEFEMTFDSSVDSASHLGAEGARFDSGQSVK